jgi:hypothetical protein
MHSVLIAERTTHCVGSNYALLQRSAIVLLAVWGLGIPAFSVAIVTLIKRLTLYNNKAAAHTLFFFMTGGIKPQYWFWEATVMARKALVTFIIVLAPSRVFKTYLCIWLFLLFFALQVAVQPYTDNLLSRLETGSAAAQL